MSSASHHYIDTCTLVGWCCSPVPGALAIDLACAAEIDALLASEGAVVGMSALTLLEFHDTIAKILRSTDKPNFDQAWFDAAVDRVMAALEGGQFVIVRPPPKVAEHAMVLVTVASRDHGAKLKAWDATHIITAAGWARQLGARVTIVTADSDFRSFFDLQGHFSSMLDLAHVHDPTVGAGP